MHAGTQHSTNVYFYFRLPLLRHFYLFFLLNIFFCATILNNIPAFSSLLLVFFIQTFPIIIIIFFLFPIYLSIFVFVHILIYDGSIESNETDFFSRLAILIENQQINIDRDRVWIHYKSVWLSVLKIERKIKSLRDNMIKIFKELTQAYEDFFYLENRFLSGKRKFWMT